MTATLSNTIARKLMTMTPAELIAYRSDARSRAISFEELAIDKAADGDMAGSAGCWKEAEVWWSVNWAAVEECDVRGLGV